MAPSKLHLTHNSSIRSDEGLTLETSASESLHIINPVDNIVILPIDAATQFL